MSQNDEQKALKAYRKKLFLLGIIKIPLIFYVRPKLLKITNDSVQVKIKLRRRTKNHLNSMYFGALAVGADVAAGIYAFYCAEKVGKKVSFAFKSVKGEFLKRAESDVLFECTEGEVINKAVKESMDSGERVNKEVKVLAFNSGGEVVADFIMEISVKVKP
jgi:acyl-coenzyme A thioesterase PaaI-like protein